MPARLYRSRGKNLHAALAWLTLLIAVGCAQPPDTRDPADAARLRIGVIPNRPPLVEYDEGDWQGLEIDLGRRVASSQGLEAQFVVVDENDPFQALRNESVDMITASLSLGAESREGFLFSRAYIQLGLRVAIRAASLAEFESAGALERAGARVGYMTRTPGGEFVRERLPLSDAYAFRDPDAAIRSLRSHRIDFFIYDGPKIETEAGRYEPSGLIVLPRVLARENYAWAVRAGDRRLLKQLNAFLDRAMAGQQLQSVYEKWFPERIQPTE